MTEPLTEAGRALFTDVEPMDMWESDGVTPGDIAAIEQEAAAAERARIAKAVSRLEVPPPDPAETPEQAASYDGGWNSARRELVRILSGGES